ncbi:NB-ARC domain-containing protein [Synechococcus sp. BDU 130192]|uniref:NB-ARC domain-containing protein n=1 Tax=Synechococcus sp. BDU 130192 TaxID=2042059 RepID=UPI000C076B17|nr:NB-ARC domain-containing protein [Synechococcus sp. BDU 130192]
MTNLTLLQLCIWLSHKHGDPLDGLRQELLLRALEGYKLKDIQIDGYSHSYVKRVIAPDLWKRLGRYCNQRVGIRSLQLALTTKYEQLSEQEKAAVDKIVPNGMAATTESQVPAPTPPQYQGIPRNKNHFYNQESTLRTLGQRLQQRDISLIFVLGGGGLGKTTLVSEVLRHHPPLQENTLWCNLSDRLMFDHNWALIQQEWALAEHPDGAIAQLQDHLQQQPKILVFDHWELLFATACLSGNYQPQHVMYVEFLEAIAHQSLAGTVVVISREHSPAIEALAMDNPRVTLITVEGLSNLVAQQILQEYNLQDPELWADLVETYRGNPLKLRLIATGIQEWYGGSVAQFQNQETIIGGNTLRDILYNLTCRISNSEQEVLYWLMLWGKSITLEQLQANFHVEMPFASEVWDAVRSLDRRFLLEKKENHRPYFGLQPSIQRYLAQEFTRECCQEIIQAIANLPQTHFNHLKHFPLMPQGADPNILTSPVICPILKGLQNRYRDFSQIQANLRRLAQNTPPANSLQHDYRQTNLTLLYETLTTYFL